MKKLFKTTLSVATGVGTALLLGQCAEQKEKETAFQYPETAKVDTVDVYFANEVKDPYRWLEDDNSEETKAWVDAQNEVTFGYLNKIPFKEKIRKRLTEVFNYPRFGQPYRIGAYYFFSKNDGLQNQSVTYFQKGLEGEPTVFLDPNSLSEDGTVTASIGGASKDDKYVTIQVNRAGSDRQEFYVMEVATKKFLSDTIKMAKFSGTSWYKDGFFYSAYGDVRNPREVDLSAKNEFHTVYYHKLGTPQTQDELVYRDGEHPQRNFYFSVSEDERFQYLYGSEGTSGTELHYKDLKKGDKAFKLLFKGFDFEYSVLDNFDGKLLVRTNEGAPNYQLALVDPAKPAMENWEILIAEKEEFLQSVSSSGGKIIARYLKDVTTRVYQYDRKGTMEREIELPALGTAYGFGGDEEDTFVFYTFTSFTYPPSIYKYEIATGESSLFKKTDVKVVPEDYITKQVFYTSKDGTKVPMFIVHKKGLKLDGTAPTLLYAYGGFNINLTPSFSSSNFVLLENGGVYAMPNLRGGGEYGEEWHKGGMLYNKQNVFDDFIAAAEYLIKEKYTSSEKLAIRGGSNGGLLVGATMTQRPDLMKVAFPAVGVLDMLRYHKFTIGWAWAVEYGTSEDSLASFNNLMAYSPLHNVKAGTSYPATMVTTADHDDRVVPAHSFKFISELQAKQTGEAPVMIRIDKDAGHGAGKPISKTIDELADMWSFMFYNVGEEPYKEVEMDREKS